MAIEAVAFYLIAFYCTRQKVLRFVIGFRNCESERDQFSSGLGARTLHLFLAVFLEIDTNIDYNTIFM